MPEGGAARDRHRRTDSRARRQRRIVAVGRCRGQASSRRRSNLDRELIGQGAANAVSGALGGMPVTGVIVRSSTNVAAGARTRASAILHGLWIAAFVLAAGSMLELIPMAALAGVLLVTGLRLVQLAHIRTLRRHDELLVYVVTAVGVGVLGLAEGVLLGLVLALARVLYRLARATVTATEADGVWTVRIRGTLVFLGVASLVRTLRSIPPGATVRVDLPWIIWTTRRPRRSRTGGAGTSRAAARSRCTAQGPPSSWTTYRSGRVAGETRGRRAATGTPVHHLCGLADRADDDHDQRSG